LPYPHAWRYRDYVIDAFNNDKPYDRFIHEQVAGDLLPASSQRERDEHTVATGFLALGVKDVNQRFKVRYIMDNVDEQIDVVGRGVLALTVSCARCHDHKFDPIPTDDYYALAGIFQSTDLCAGLRNKMGGGGLDYYDSAMLLKLGPTLPPAPEQAARIEKATQAVKEATAEFEALRGKPEGNANGPDGKPKRATARQKMTRLQAELQALLDPAVNGPVAIGVRDAKAVRDTEIRVRGEAEKLGPVVPRGFLSAVNVPNAPKISSAQSGRLELAQWLTSRQNPLTSRVIVNRIWQHLFGEGLVASVDNFGVTGELPSHPELLDHLALQFMQDGWSVKRLVRKIVLSRAYRLGSDAPEANIAVDPANRLVWRHSPRRLEAEEIRDAVLAIAGDLDATPPQASQAKDFKVIELSDNGQEARRLEQQGAADKHRSIYLPLLRGLTPRVLEVFDFADQGLVTGNRDSTTVSPQALYMLNDPFVGREALALTAKLLRQTALDDAGRVDAAYRLTLGRVASQKEIRRALQYVVDYEASVRPIDVTPVALAAKELPSATSPSTGDAGKPALPQPKKQTGPAPEKEPKPPDAKSAAWTSFCQALLGSAEFRYVR
jgi:hypothetical protein